MRAGYRAVPAIISYVALVVGGSIALTFTWGRKHLLWGVVLLLAAVVVTILEGSYQEARRLEEKHAEELAALRTEHAAALAEAQAKPTTPIHAPTFWDVQGGTVAGNEITNTYNASGEGAPGQGGFGGRLIAVGPNAGGISGSEINVQYGPSSPLPDPLPSTLEERAQLRDQLLKLAAKIEAVMAPWGSSIPDVAAKMGVPPGEIMARVAEIRSERTRIDDEAAARYNSECRSTVVQAYNHARSIGFADDEMERFWRTRLGAGASAIPARLRAIAARIHG